MKKIIVAGAGHGGVTAALNLAKAGYKVTVYEKKPKNQLGYDWVDCMRKDTFEETGFPRPDESVFTDMADQAYYNPKKSVKVVVEKDYGGRLGYIERKLLINHIIDFAQENGVKFFFGAEVVCALYDETRVTGIKIKKNGREKDVFADMVIDAAGLNSPVRSTLPECFGVRRHAHRDEIFCTWRGSFRKTAEFKTEPKNTIYFYHCGKSGMDWVIDEGETVDILIGGFGELTEKQINDALEDFRADYSIENTPVRGGYGDSIPLGRVLSVMVCNSYAAVGNSAFMTEPLSGSGIDMSMHAGKILADTIIEAKDNFSTEKLWKYNYTAFKNHGEHQYNNIIVKSFLAFLTAEDIDFFFEKKILTAREIGGGGNTKYTLPDLVQKVSILGKPKLILPLTGILKKAMLLEKLKRDIPEAYNKTAVTKWKNEYSKVR